MSNNWKTVITTASIVAAVAGASTLHAQTTAPSKPQGGGMMMQGQNGDMMNMMGQMNQMMETCNKMMKDMDMGQRPGTEKDPKAQPKKG